MKNKLIEILTEGFATAPSRDWITERNLTATEMEKKRTENLAHIDRLADEILNCLKIK